MAKEEEIKKTAKEPIEIKPDLDLRSEIIASASSVKDKGNKERNMENSKYYYLCSYPLREGSIIEKGNWGRFLRKYPNFQLFEGLLMNSRFSGDAIIGGGEQKVIIDQKVIRELIFERVRKNEFPDTPSRLDCIFVCKTLDGAKSFKSGSRRNWDLIYEVEPTDVNSRRLETDWSWINGPIINKTIHEIEEDARKYWRGEIQNQDKKELLWDCGVRILHKVDV